MGSRRPRTLLGLLVIVVFASGLIGAAGAAADESVYPCQGFGVFPFGSNSSGQFATPNGCPLEIEATGGAMAQGSSASWQADAPAGLSIVERG